MPDSPKRRLTTCGRNSSGVADTIADRRLSAEAAVIGSATPVSTDDIWPPPMRAQQRGIRPPT